MVTNVVGAVGVAVQGNANRMSIGSTVRAKIPDAVAYGKFGAREVAFIKCLVWIVALASPAKVGANVFKQAFSTVLVRVPLVLVLIVVL